MLKIVLYIGDTPKGLMHKSIPDRATAIQIDAVLDTIEKAFKRQRLKLTRAEISNFKEI